MSAELFVWRFEIIVTTNLGYCLMVYLSRGWLLPNVNLNWKPLIPSVLTQSDSKWTTDPSVESSQASWRLSEAWWERWIWASGESEFSIIELTQLHKRQNQTRPAFWKNAVGTCQLAHRKMVSGLPKAKGLLSCFIISGCMVSNTPIFAVLYEHWWPAIGRDTVGGQATEFLSGSCDSL